jgi:hypothetical protein
VKAITSNFTHAGQYSYCVHREIIHWKKKERKEGRKKERKVGRTEGRKKGRKDERWDKKKKGRKKEM